MTTQSETDRFSEQASELLRVCPECDHPWAEHWIDTLNFTGCYDGCKCDVDYNAADAIERIAAALAAAHAAGVIERNAAWAREIQHEVDTCDNAAVCLKFALVATRMGAVLV